MRSGKKNASLSNFFAGTMLGIAASFVAKKTTPPSVQDTDTLPGGEYIPGETHTISGEFGEYTISGASETIPGAWHEVGSVEDPIVVKDPDDTITANND